MTITRAVGTADGTVSIQDAARLTGIPPHTLRWYDRVGLVPDIERCSTGRRRFTADNLEWIRILRVLRSTGMPVATLRDLTEHHHDGNPERPAGLVRMHRTQVLALMTMLHRSLELLDSVEDELVRTPRTTTAGT